MMALYFMILLLICGGGVHSDESTLELGSGDMDTPTTAVPSVNLIDGNGDIVTGIRTNPPDDLKNFTSHDDIGSATEVVEFNSEENLRDESSTLKNDNTYDGETYSYRWTTTENTTATENTTTTETTTKSDPPTTTTETTTMAATTTTTTAAPITTVTSTTSTEIPTTTFDGTTVISEKKQTTMTNMKQTTTSSSTTAATVKNDKPTGHSAHTQAEGEIEMCVFMSEDFKCEEPVICFGEGEIDCSGGEDSISSSSSTSEDYSVDEDPESVTIGTFPPNLVGVGTPKKISFYNRQSLTTEGANEKAEDDVHEYSEKEMNLATTEMTEAVSSTTTKMVEDVNNTPTEPTVTTESDFTVMTTVNGNAENVFEMKETTPAEEPASTTILKTTEEATSLPTTASALLDAVTNSNYTEETSPTVPADSDASTAMSEKPAADSGIIRRRRGISHEGYTPEPHYEELYKKKDDNRLDKMRNETCRLRGNIKCLPVPTLRNCAGKTFCQAVRIKSEVPAPSKQKGLEIWMIIVIVICGLFGFTTIGMVIYLIVHSCKKLKVQPAHDVLPLNYITKKSEPVETA